MDLKLAPNASYAVGSHDDNLCWYTGIGSLLEELSTPSCPGERTYLHREDASQLLRHLTRGGSADRWDESACRRLKAEIRQRATVTDSARSNEEYVARKYQSLCRHWDDPDNRHSGDPFRIDRAAERWIGEPLQRFTRDLDASYANGGRFLKPGARAYLRAVFVACLFDANSGSNVPAQPSAARVPAPPVRPRDGTTNNLNGPGRFRS